MEFNPEEQVVVGIGAGALDVYAKAGVTTEGYAPGAKDDTFMYEDARQVAEKAREDIDRSVKNGTEPNYTITLGGNVVNGQARLTSLGYKAIFAGVLGDNDPASIAIKDHLPKIGIENHAVVVPGYKPSISYVERGTESGIDEDGNAFEYILDRMIRGVPRDSIREHLTPEYLKKVISLGNFAFVASIKDPETNELIFELIPEDMEFAYVAGGSEYGNHPEKLQKIMRKRKPTLAGPNDQELPALLLEPENKPDPSTDKGRSELQRMAARATKMGLAEYILTTMGTHGLILAHNGVSIIRPAVEVPRKNVKDTLGSGDAVTAEVFHGILAGHEGEKILDRAALVGATVVQNVGGHTDLLVPKPKKLIRV